MPSPNDLPAAGAPMFPPVVLRGLRPEATLQELLDAMSHEAAMHSMASAWGVSLTAALLEKAGMALRQRAGDGELQRQAVSGACPR